MERKGKKISIKEVAKLAGVSPTTVSRVINNSDHPVNSKTRAAVEAAIKKLNFRPNRMAQGLINNHSYIVGVIVHDISDAYFAQIVKGIEKIMFDYDYIVNIYNTYRDIDKEIKAVNMLSINQADAVILAGGSLMDDRYNEVMRDCIAELKANGSIVIGVTPHPFDIKNIEIGNTLAARMITDYLLNKGHKNIAYINGPQILYTSRERLKGYLEALEDRGIDVEEEFILEGDFSFEGGRKAAVKLLKFLGDITAVVASNDEMALGLLWELKNQGVRVPEQISVVGIGNIPGSEYSYPPLTTIALPIYELGVYIGEYIIASLQGDKILHDFNVQIGLIERGSVQELIRN